MNKKNILLLLTSFFALGILSYCFLIKKKESPIQIVKYDKDIHYEFAKKVIFDNYFWVIQGWKKENYPIDERLIEQIPYPKQSDKIPPFLNIDIALYKSEMSGFISYYFEENDNMKYGMIQILSVSKDFSRKGIGRALMQHAMEELMKKDIDFIYLTVRYDNIPAYNLYVDLGFSKIENNETSDSDDSDIHLIYRIKK